MVLPEDQRQKSMKKLLTLIIAVAGMAALSANAGDAKAAYDKDCAKCHGADGKALPQADLSNPAVIAKFPRSLQLLASRIVAMSFCEPRS